MKRSVELWDDRPAKLPRYAPDKINERRDTGERDEYGRKIYRGPQGGLYVTERVRASGGGRDWFDSGLTTYDGLPLYFTLIDGADGNPMAIFRMRDGGGTLMKVDISANTQKELTRIALEHYYSNRAALQQDYRQYITTKRKASDPKPIAPVKKRVKILRIEHPFDRTTKDIMLPVEVYDKSEGNLANRVRNGRAVGTRSSNIDQEWFTEQGQYLMSLSEDDLLTVAAYTNRSWAWVGAYQDKKAVPAHGSKNYNDMVGMGMAPGQIRYVTPLFPQMQACIRKQTSVSALQDMFNGALVKLSTKEGRDELMTLMGNNQAGSNRIRQYRKYQRMLEAGAFSNRALECALEQYTTDLKRIIANAPPVREPITTYRGTAHDPYKTFPPTTKKLPRFISAAFTAEHSLRYTGSDPDKSVLQRIKVRAGTRALLVAGVNPWRKHGEYEIVFNVDTPLQVVQRAVDRIVVGRKGKLYGSRVSDIVLGP